MKSDLTQTMQTLWSDCSALFNLILYRSEQNKKNNFFIAIIENSDHQKLTVLDCLQLKYCQIKF